MFISYSRRDEAFVERLRGALADRGKDVWLDREDIGPAVEWRRELELGIEASDVFAFVISPDSLRSEPCRREREYAVAKGKRIVPMLRSEPEGIEVPEDLASRNYIFVRTDGEFEPGVAALLAAIDDLPEWARDHTRLLERAEEWDHHQRDPSFLLRGSDLSEAERWLAEQGAHKEPQPTPLQTEYLLVSRKAATRRQRLTIGAGALALVVSVVLGLLALLQRNEAQDQRDEAVRQAQLANSRELAAASIAKLEADPWEALELAVEASEVSATPESTDALRGALQAPREEVALELPGDTITTARFTDDSAHVLTTSNDGRQRRWNLASGEYSVFGRRYAAGPFPSTEEASPDGQLRVTARRSGVRITDASTGGELVELDRLGPGAEGVIRGAEFSPDGRAFLTAGYDARARVWPLGLRLLGSEVAAGAISDDGESCLTADFEGTVTMWSCANGEKLWTRRLRAPRANSRITSIDADFAGGDEQVIVSTVLTTAVLDAGDGDTLLQLEGSRKLGSSPTVAPSGSVALRAVSMRRAEVIGLPGEERITTLPVDLPFGGGRVSWADDDQRVAIAAYQDPLVRVADLSPTGRTTTIDQFEAPVFDIELNADGSILLTASGDAVERWDAATNQRVGKLTSVDLVFSAAFAADERFLVTGEADESARVWETASGRPVAAFPAGSVPAEASLSAGGRLLAVGYRGSALVVDCLACRPAPELLATARAELERRPASAASPAGP